MAERFWDRMPADELEPAKLDVEETMTESLRTKQTIPSPILSEDFLPASSIRKKDGQVVELFKPPFNTEEKMIIRTTRDNTNLAS
ncbi:hypothetical protein MMC15_008323 [Xylographa vitiligo]|nr:hypothetical protein [Xylographa vitiligo]